MRISNVRYKGEALEVDILIVSPLGSSHAGLLSATQMC